MRRAGNRTGPATMLGSVHCTGAFVISEHGQLYKTGVSQIRVQRVQTEPGDLVLGRSLGSEGLSLV